MSLDSASNRLQPQRMWRCATAIAPDVGLLQNQVLALPRRGQGVSLPGYCRNSLVMRRTTFRATAAHRYGMLPRSQGAVVGLTRLD